VLIAFVHPLALATDGFSVSQSRVGVSEKRGILLLAPTISFTHARRRSSMSSVATAAVTSPTAPLVFARDPWLVAYVLPWSRKAAPDNASTRLHQQQQQQQQQQQPLPFTDHAFAWQSEIDATAAEHEAATSRAKKPKRKAKNVVDEEDDEDDRVETGNQEDDDDTEEDDEPIVIPKASKRKTKVPAALPPAVPLPQPESSSAESSEVGAHDPSPEQLLQLQTRRLFLRRYSGKKEIGQGLRTLVWTQFLRSRLSQTHLVPSICALTIAKTGFRTTSVDSAETTIDPTPSLLTLVDASDGHIVGTLEHLVQQERALSMELWSRPFPALFSIIANLCSTQGALSQCGLVGARLWHPRNVRLIRLRVPGVAPGSAGWVLQPQDWSMLRNVQPLVHGRHRVLLERDARAWTLMRRACARLLWCVLFGRDTLEQHAPKTVDEIWHMVVRGKAGDKSDDDGPTPPAFDSWLTRLRISSVTARQLTQLLAAFALPPNATQTLDEAVVEGLPIWDRWSFAWDGGHGPASFITRPVLRTTDVCRVSELWMSPSHVDARARVVGQLLRTSQVVFETTLREWLVGLLAFDLLLPAHVEKKASWNALLVLLQQALRYARFLLNAPNDTATSKGASTSAAAAAVEGSFGLDYPDAGFLIAFFSVAPPSRWSPSGDWSGLYFDSTGQVQASSVVTLAYIGARQRCLFHLSLHPERLAAFVQHQLSECSSVRQVGAAPFRWFTEAYSQKYILPPFGNETLTVQNATTRSLADVLGHPSEYLRWETLFVDLRAEPTSLERRFGDGVSLRMRTNTVARRIRLPAARMDHATLDALHHACIVHEILSGRTLDCVTLQDGELLFVEQSWPYLEPADRAMTLSAFLRSSTSAARLRHEGVMVSLLRWMLHILGQLTDLHEQGLVYGQLHSDHILVAPRTSDEVWDVELIDVGSVVPEHAKVVRRDGGGGFIWSQRMAAPEYWADPEALQWSKPLDIWAFGCWLIELLTLGQVPLFPQVEEDEGSIEAAAMMSSSLASREFHKQFVEMTQHCAARVGEDDVQQMMSTVQKGDQVDSDDGGDATVRALEHWLSCRFPESLVRPFLWDTGLQSAALQIQLHSTWINLAARCLHPQPERRISASHALKHPLWSLIRGDPQRGAITNAQQQQHASSSSSSSSSACATSLQGEPTLNSEDPTYKATWTVARRLAVEASLYFACRHRSVTFDMLLLTISLLDAALPSVVFGTPLTAADSSNSNSNSGSQQVLAHWQKHVQPTMAMVWAFLHESTTALPPWLHLEGSALRLQFTVISAVQGNIVRDFRPDPSALVTAVFAAALSFYPRQTMRRTLDDLRSCEASTAHIAQTRVDFTVAALKRIQLPNDTAPTGDSRVADYFRLDALRALFGSGLFENAS
jgi:serine/threonine protein kinase